MDKLKKHEDYLKKKTKILNKLNKQLQKELPK